MLSLLASTSALCPPAAATLYHSIPSTCVATPARLRVSHAPVASLPTISVLAGVCTAPTLLGYWKTEYGVSYAYGAAMAACGGLVWPAAVKCGPLAAAHALVLVLYGVRLNAFLLYRELTVPRFRSFREKIEARSKQQGGRLKRTPFVLGCSFLYFCMGAPLRLTAVTPASGVAKVALFLEVLLMYVGFLVAAVGDSHKSYAKAQRGDDALVVTGIFRYLRHPNYTGELLLWGASVAAALTVAPAALAAGAPLLTITWSLAAAGVGYAGIGFVLVNAASSLEKKQREKYGQELPAGLYERWVASSWSGPTRA
uniref:Steroid 5-alpha reductase C-terminal domain-containing protein n=1 Tax=Coccolithus braarudii TaxID=221442 RepID=A0A7S0Q6W4_9EUKA